MTQRLPARFPVGTKFVVELHRQGRGKVYRRHLEFPDGTVLRLPSPPALDAAGEQRMRLRPRAHAGKPERKKKGPEGPWGIVAVPARAGKLKRTAKVGGYRKRLAPAARYRLVGSM